MENLCKLCKTWVTPLTQFYLHNFVLLHIKTASFCSTNQLLNWLVVKGVVKLCILKLVVEHPNMKGHFPTKCKALKKINLSFKCMILNYVTEHNKARQQEQSTWKCKAKPTYPGGTVVKLLAASLNPALVPTITWSYYIITFKSQQLWWVHLIHYI